MTINKGEQDLAEIKSYHFYLENTSEFRKTAKHMLIEFYYYLLRSKIYRLAAAEHMSGAFRNATL